MPSNPIRTLKIAEIAIGESFGKIGFTYLPGETRANEATPASEPERRVDYELVHRWDAAALVTLVDPAGLDLPGIPRLGNALWDGFHVLYYLPIRDDGLPDPHYEEVWQESGEELRAVLRTGANVLFNCETRRSRGGLVAAKLLSELGVAPAQAIAAVTSHNPSAIETPAELNYILKLKPVAEPVPPRSREALETRALGAMLCHLRSQAAMLDYRSAA